MGRYLIMIKDINKSSYKITLDESTGKLTGIYDSADPKTNWLKENDKTGFCAPFIHGTQWNQDYLVCPLKVKDGYIFGETESLATKIKILPEDDIIRISFETPVDNGPRIGLQMNLNLLDLPYEGSNLKQCMPKIIYVDENYKYAYVVFGTSDHRYLILTVSSPLAAWRIEYSYFGHRILGFQLLTQADDVRTDGRPSLPAVEKLDIQIQFSTDITDCMKKISSVLGRAIAVPRISGGPEGADIPFDIIGDAADIKVTDPDGTVSEYEEKTVHLTKRGIYQITAETEDGLSHTTRILCHESWEAQLDRVNNFYREHMQHSCGACFRAISTDTLLPDKYILGGNAMGDPESHYSCRTGEFGGFTAWAILKNELLFGSKPELHDSVERYMLNWALSRGHEDKPYLGGLNKNPHKFLGRNYGPYHLYEEFNYMQHEIFLLEECADYYRLTGDESVAEDAMNIVRHIEKEHLREDGTLINQNDPDEEGIDYNTVHVAICGFLRWADIFRECDPQKAEYLLNISEKIADSVCRRALNFPTEGEPCTEDGSMGCSAATLAYAYLMVKPKPEYLAVAKEILSAHHVLEMAGTDCRMKNSSIRFWETQYETRSWGPSINAGHAWSIWTAEAKAAMAVIEKSYSLLKESYEGFITNICKVTDCGGMYSCYTPDMIPGTPHAYNLDRMKDEALEHNDIHPTTTHLGMSFPTGAYAASGNYYLIKAADIWSRISGFDPSENTAVNGILKNGEFHSCADNFDYLLISGSFMGKIRIYTGNVHEIRIVCHKDLQVENAAVISREGGLTVKCTGEYFTLSM